jgi:hypothetical protein
MNPKINGMSIIMRAWLGSVEGEGIIFWYRNWLAIMMMGRILIARCSGCERSVTQSQFAPRISTATMNTL